MIYYTFTHHFVSIVYYTYDKKNMALCLISSHIEAEVRGPIQPPGPHTAGNGLGRYLPQLCSPLGHERNEF